MVVRLFNQAGTEWNLRPYLDGDPVFKMADAPQRNLLVLGEYINLNDEKVGWYLYGKVKISSSYWLGVYIVQNNSVTVFC